MLYSRNICISLWCTKTPLVIKNLKWADFVLSSGLNQKFSNYRKDLMILVNQKTADKWNTTVLDFWRASGRDQNFKAARPRSNSPKFGTAHFADQEWPQMTSSYLRWPKMTFLMSHHWSVITWLTSNDLIWPSSWPLWWPF